MTSNFFSLFKQIPSKFTFTLLIVFFANLFIASNTFAEQFKYEAAKMPVKGFLIEGTKDQSELQTEKHKSSVNTIIESDMQKNSLGYDIDALRELTDKITNYYRSQGFFLATSYVPQQTANDGYIVIKIIEGTLSAVIPQDNKVFSSELLQEKFADYIGKAVTKDEIETATLLVNDLPGYKGTAIFSPGQKIGETALILKSEEEHKEIYSIGFDNFGNEGTGKQRTRGDFIFNNLSGKADQLSFNVLYARNFVFMEENDDESKSLNFFKMDDPAYSISLSTSYSMPIINSQTQLYLNHSFNKYFVGQDVDVLSFEGENHSLNAITTYKHTRSEAKNLFYTAGLSYKYIESSGLTDDQFENLFTLNIGATLSGDSKLLNGKFALTSTLTQSLTDKLDNTKKYEKIYTKLNVNGSHSFAIPQKPNQYVLAKSNIQLSNKTLPSSEKLILGGNHGIRGVPASEYAVDDGIILNLEWIAKSKFTEDYAWFKNMQVTGFLDSGYGSYTVIDSLVPADFTTFQYSVGANLNLQPSKKFNLNSTLAYRPSKLDSVEEQHFALLLNLTYKF